MLTASSSCSWTEVSLLLRQPIHTEEDMHYTAAAAEAGILFTDQVQAIPLLHCWLCVGPLLRSLSAGPFATLPCPVLLPRLTPH